MRVSYVLLLLAAFAFSCQLADPSNDSDLAFAPSDSPVTISFVVGGVT